jgi:uncharacterized RDD family membrane protein YckC
MPSTGERRHHATCQDWAVNPVERLLGAVINPVVDAVDVEGVVAKVDVDRLVTEVDLDALLEKVDIEALLARIDVDALLDRIDVDELLARIDVTKLTDRIDVQALVDRLDVQSVIDKVDIDALVDKVDVAALAQRAGIDDIVSEATRGVTSRVLAMARRQIVGLDLIVSGIWARLVRRPRPQPPSGTSATGAVAGPVSRLLAYFVDIAVLSLSFTAVSAMVSYLVQLFIGDKVNTSTSNARWGVAFAGSYLLLAFVYYLVGLTIAGSSVGKALLGLRVLNLDGRPLKGRQALVRVIVYPFSFILGLGLMPIVTAKSHRALHDKVARTTVRYDWGDSDQVSRTPLTRWLRGKPAGSWVLAEEAEEAATPSPTRAPAPAPATTVATVGNGAAANGNGTAKPTVRADQ